MENDQINLEQLLNEAAGGTSETSPATEQTQQEEQTPPATETSPATEQTQQEEQTPPATEQTQPKEEKEKQKTNPIKEVRDQLNETKKVKDFIEKTMQRFTDGDYNLKLKDYKTEDGKVDYEALSKAMDEIDNKVKAEARGVTPEIQAEIDRIEREKVEINKQRIQVAMDRSLAELQVSMNLDKEAINNFFKDSLAVNKNPYQWLAQGGSLEDLYYLIYRESLTKATVDNAVNKAKEEWEKNSRVVPPISNPAKQTQSTNQNGISLADLKAEAAAK